MAETSCRKSRVEQCSKYISLCDDPAQPHEDRPMTPPARLSAAIAVLDRILGGVPAEQALTNWARASRFAGSGDRAAIRDLVFDALRCRRSFAALGAGMTGRGLILGGLRAAGVDPDELFTGQGHAPAALSDDEAHAGCGASGACGARLPGLAGTRPARQSRGRFRAGDGDLAPPRSGLSAGEHGARNAGSGESSTCRRRDRCPSA